ncbi:MAG: sigma-54-dependent Fis family transcriptional regulator [Candidatus Cloacimonetes bacterium]|nr:sigma-54-dependent Fis family transcriptional regulator [Candidatus Cloacimonadota bacterium]HPM00876.1 sigma-54 dependent transcriptional regulator [Candidatus Cloacimonadota bacterium]
MKIFILDDEKNICISLKNILEDEGYACSYSTSVEEGRKIIEGNVPDLLLLDVQLKDGNGLDFLKQIKEVLPDLLVVMISGHSGIKEAVQAMKSGAFDFLEKPLNLTRVKLTVQNALSYSTLQEDYKILKESFNEQYRIIGSSQAIQEVLQLAQKVAKTNSRVLIRGESGSGKELLAYAIHNQSQRSKGPFIKFNSAAIPNELVESELFGYEKGAFTGAVKSKKGKLELADKGTLFLDEIGDMNLSAQAKILRVLQEGEFERVGSNEIIKIDTRIIAATHKNLEEMIENGLFREDLFYRLNVVPLISPALRERREDIPLLVEFFCHKFAAEFNLPLKTLSDGALRQIMNQEFKGNIRELRNLIERLYILSDGNVISESDLPLPSIKSEHKDNSFWEITTSYQDKKEEFEFKYLSKQLEIHDFNVSRTANALGLQQSNLSRKLKELNINIKEK